MTIISQIILQDICVTLRTAFNINQCCRSTDPSFRKLKYMSCSPLLNLTLEYFTLLLQKILKIKHFHTLKNKEATLLIIQNCCCTLIYNNIEIWIKMSTKSNQDEPIVLTRMRLWVACQYSDIPWISRPLLGWESNCVVHSISLQTFLYRHLQLL